MAIQSYSAPQAARIGKLAGQIIDHAIAVEVLSKTVTNYKIGRNQSDTLVLRSWIPYGATVAQPNQWIVKSEAHITQEGVTPDADTIIARDVPIMLNQYHCLYALTDRDYDLYEDDVAAAMKEQVGERVGMIQEMAIYAKMKGSTNKFYAGGGSSRAAVNAAITPQLVSKIVRSLQANHGQKIRSVLAPSRDFNTAPIEAAYVWYTHTDASYDIRNNLPDFISTAQYGQRTLISEYELGSWQDVRFVVSPELYPYNDAGAAVGATGLKSTTGTNVDVYPNLVMAKDCFGQLALRGATAINPIWIPPGKEDKSDPLGQRGYVGCKFYAGHEITNQGWLACAEVGVSNL